MRLKQDKQGPKLAEHGDFHLQWALLRPHKRPFRIWRDEVCVEHGKQSVQVR